MSKLICTTALLSALALSSAAFAQGSSTMPSSTSMPSASSSPSTMSTPAPAMKKPMASRRSAKVGATAVGAEEQATAQLNLRQIGQ